VHNYPNMYSSIKPFRTAATEMSSVHSPIYGRDDQRVAIFSSTKLPDRLWSIPRPLFNGYTETSLQRLKRPGREADHSLPSSAEVKSKAARTLQKSGSRFKILGPRRVA
jgi:hypothetical protein